ncbi:MAG: hypothetical protein H7841_14140 [Magnetospirillum sp. WYHS-4]
MPTIIAGLLAVAFGLWGLTVWWWSVMELLRGVVPIVLIVVGLLTLAAGLTKVRANKDEDATDEELLGE